MMLHITNFSSFDFVKSLGSVHKLREGGMGDLRGGGLKNFLQRKGGDLKCFQNTEVTTSNI